MDPLFHKIVQDRKQVTVRYDSKTEAIWTYANPEECPCFNIEFFQEFHDVQMDVINYFKANNMKPKIPIKFFVYASQVPGVYGYGGALNGLVKAFKEKDRDNLEACAKVAIKNMYLNTHNLNLPLQTIAFIEGDALGGAFQAALSFNAIIAEEQSQFGLQQIRFNMCPGIGLYSFLARKVGMNNADKIIKHSRMYTAQEIHEMGAITEIAKEGEGKKVVDRYMQLYRRSFKVMQTLHAAKFRYAPFEFEELEDMAAMWVDSMLNLDEEDIARLEKIAESQKQQIYGIPQRLRAKQDRRFDTPTGSFPLMDADGKVIKEDRRGNSDPRTQG
jgi:DSF synthase